MLRHAPRRARQAAQKQTCNMCTSSESGRRRPAYPREAGSAHGQAGGRRLPAYPRGERPAQPVVKLAAGGWHIPERARVAGSARQAGGRRRRSLHILERREAGSARQAGGRHIPERGERLAQPVRLAAVGRVGRRAVGRVGRRAWTAVGRWARTTAWTPGTPGGRVAQASRQASWVASREAVRLKMDRRRGPAAAAAAVPPASR